MAPEFFPQRVLASEERSGDYVRASMCALRGKGQIRARPAQSVAASPLNGTNQGTKDKPLSLCIQRPGEKCGLIEAQQKTITKTVSETLDHRIGGRYKRRSMMKSLVTAITWRGDCQGITVTV